VNSDLVIHLNAIAYNWLQLKAKLNPTVECGAVVKADAYGLGVIPVVQVLLKAGCRHFYVASLQEALFVQGQLDEIVEAHGLSTADCQLYVLSGCAPGEELVFAEHRIVPVLISGEMFFRWCSALRGAGLRSGSVSSVLKVDTGMSRLGLSQDEFDLVVASPKDLQTAGVKRLMSHLACADEPNHPQNERQLQRFQRYASRLKKLLPSLKCGLANSAGILLGDDYHFDTVRPGIAIYGGNPQLRAENIFRPVVELKLPVLQVREISSDACVGYGATYCFSLPARVAVVAGGYADGLFRALSNHGECWIEKKGGKGWRAPIVGRISMDSTIVDISHLAESTVKAGDRLEFIGKNISLDEVAEKAGTIGYEVLTALGHRYLRTYKS